MSFTSIHRAALLVSAALLMGACSGSSGGTSPAPTTTVSQPAPAAAPPPPALTEPPPPPPQEQTAPTSQPAGQPSVRLAAADSVVPRGSNAVLNWSSSHADACTASGGWGGSKPTSGSESVGPLSQRTTFSLSCSGAGGNAMVMISVAVSATVTLEWQPPTENVDGTPLTNLAGYRIYYGTGSRDYTEVVAIDSPTATSYSIVLPSGTYYFAMTARDADGNESGYSNEVVKIVD
jgi:hypothetical protein